MFREEEEEQEFKPETKSTKKISTYFSAQSTKPNKKQKVNKFFKERNLEIVSNFDGF